MGVASSPFVHKHVSTVMADFDDDFSDPEDFVDDISDEG